MILAALMLFCSLGCSWVGGDDRSSTDATVDTTFSEGLVDTGSADCDPADFEQATVEKVVDGDTLKLRLSDGSTQRVRLVGIDAPESVAEDESRNCEEGVEASDYMKSLVGPGDVVYLQTTESDQDKYGRLLRYVWLTRPTDATDPDEVATEMLDGIMVYQGYACSKRYRPDTAYNALFDEFMDDAADNERGVYEYWL